MENVSIENTDANARGITDREINGEILHLASADPSNIWKAIFSDVSSFRVAQSHTP